MPKQDELGGRIVDTLRSALEKEKVSREQLADDLGVKNIRGEPDGRSVGHWLSPKLQRPVPAYQLPRLCRRLKNYKTLDLLEAAAGRIIVVVHHDHETIPHQNDIRAIQGLAKEVAEAIDSLAETLADGEVKPHELDDTLPKLKDVIDECIKLKHWLEARCEADKAKARSKS